MLVLLFSSYVTTMALAAFEFPGQRREPERRYRVSHSLSPPIELHRARQLLVLVPSSICIFVSMLALARVPVSLSVPMPVPIRGGELGEARHGRAADIGVGVGMLLHRQWIGGTDGDPAQTISRQRLGTATITITTTAATVASLLGSAQP